MCPYTIQLLLCYVIGLVSTSSNLMYPSTLKISHSDLFTSSFGGLNCYIMCCEHSTLNFASKGKISFQSISMLEWIKCLIDKLVFPS